MNFIKVTAWHCDKDGNPDKLTPQENFKLNINHILSVKDRKVWLKENVIKLNGNYYCEIQFDQEISLENL